VDFGSMIKVAMLLLSRRDEVGKAVDLIREVTNAVEQNHPAQRQHNQVVIQSVACRGCRNRSTN